MVFWMVLVVMVIVMVDCFELFDVNDGFVVMMGYVQVDFFGKFVDEIGLWVECGVWLCIEGWFVGDGYVCNVDVQICMCDGDVCDCVVLVDFVVIYGCDCLFVVLFDISDCKCMEMEFVYVIEIVMQDVLWFSCMLIEKFVNVWCVNVLDVGVQLFDLIVCECDVFDLLCYGLVDKEIVGCFGFVLNIVCNYVVMIYVKFDVYSCGEVIVWVCECGIVGMVELNGVCGDKGGVKGKD